MQIPQTEPSCAMVVSMAFCFGSQASITRAHIMQTSAQQLGPHQPQLVQVRPGASVAPLCAHPLWLSQLAI